MKLIGFESAKDFVMSIDGVFKFKNKVRIPNDVKLNRLVLKERHISRLSIHSGMNKMYQDLKDSFWWSDMKHDVA
ncbi:hypothetical protein VIGAN_01059400 [Vigna angularis var. angularis]|uniref:Integrase zinc-binding domain-containing protein n=1 Tax=Vigna angularis var. angularis TaxID=157739 RepID=A0A0S3QXQ4_PHAAN|nr:hypothetical protein VIGAN_01059400 [Vigna angularis var. angularis]